jgi:hypothetical protein
METLDNTVPTQSAFSSNRGAIGSSAETSRFDIYIRSNKDVVSFNFKFLTKYRKVTVSRT